MANVSIIGSGFAALAAIRELRRRDRRSAVTLVSPRAEFVYSPSLIWVPTGLRDGAELVFPLDRFLGSHGVHHHAGRVTAIEDGGRTVITDAGRIANDGLLIAGGGRFLKKLPGIEHALTICEGVEPARHVRDRLERMEGGTIAVGFAGNPQEPQAMRGGPMFELLFGIDTWLRRQELRERFRLVFFSPAPEPGKRLGEQALSLIFAELERRGIETRLGQKLSRFTANAVVTEGGEFAADLILFMPGLTGPEWANASGLPLSPGGFVQADEYGRVPGCANVFVAGDAGSFSGPDWLPKQAHMAELQARAAARNLLLALAGHTPAHKFRPELVCIIDTLDRGILVYRSPRRALAFSSRWLHAAKRLFEWHYTSFLRT